MLIEGLYVIMFTSATLLICVSCLILMLVAWNIKSCVSKKEEVIPDSKPDTKSDGELEFGPVGQWHKTEPSFSPFGVWSESDPISYTDNAVPVCKTETEIITEHVPKPKSTVESTVESAINVKDEELDRDWLFEKQAAKLDMDKPYEGEWDVLSVKTVIKKSLHNMADFGVGAATDALELLPEAELQAYAENMLTTLGKDITRDKIYFSVCADIR